MYEDEDAESSVNKSNNKSNNSNKNNVSSSKPKGINGAFKKKSIGKKNETTNEKQDDIDLSDDNWETHIDSTNIK